MKLFEFEYILFRIPTLSPDSLEIHIHVPRFFRIERDEMIIHRLIDESNYEKFNILEILLISLPTNPTFKMQRMQNDSKSALDTT